MKISLKWLKDYVPIEPDTDGLADKLTMAGLEVESIEKIGTDSVFELEVTPNRPDCLNMLGIAREIAAITGGNFCKPKASKWGLPKNTVPVDIQDKTLCSRYIGIRIDNLVVQSAPKDIQTRLGALGIRSVNNIVDITNFSLWENGQPLHAFDYDKLAGGKIIVRRAKDGEKILAIDGNEYLLDPSILIIADAEKPVAIAGIMGGKATEVSASTKSVLLESACFDPVIIRRAVRKLALSSDSSYRFERGIYSEMVEAGAKRAVGLIKEHAKGIVSAYKDVYSQKKKKQDKPIKVSVEHLNKYLGATITSPQCRSILKKLEFNVTSQGSGVLLVVPPGFRGDIHETVDVYEEVARVIGFDQLPNNVAAVCAFNIPPSRLWQDKKDLRDAFRGVGCDEILTYSLTCQEHIRRCQMDHMDVLRIRNPLSADYDTLRPSLLPTHFPVIVNNINRGQKNLCFFEIGKIYNLNREQDVLGVIITGSQNRDWRSTEKKNLDFYDIKGVVTSALESLGIQRIHCVAIKKEGLAKGESAEIYIGDKAIGMIGRVDSNVLRDWNFKGQLVYFAEILLEPVFEKRKREVEFRSPSEYPAMIRDISLAVRQEVSFQMITDLVEAHAGEFLKGIQFIEEYVGDKISAGMRGLVFSLQFQSDSRTLTDDEVSTAVESVRNILIKDLGAVSR